MLGLLLWGPTECRCFFCIGCISRTWVTLWCAFVVTDTRFFGLFLVWFCSSHVVTCVWALSFIVLFGLQCVYNLCFGVFVKLRTRAPCFFFGVFFLLCAIMEFNAEKFVAHPTLEEFHLCTKEHLISLASFLEIPVTKQMKKQSLKAEISSVLSKKGLLRSEETVKGTDSDVGQAVRSRSWRLRCAV